MRFVQLLAVVLLLLGATSRTQEHGWRGIVPLHSTRADVERLIGKPEIRGDFYDYESERVTVVYQRHTCEESKGEGYNVPKDIVLFLRVNFKNSERPMSAFPVDWAQYEKSEGGDYVGYANYSNRAKGISYETYEGKVVAVEYGGTTADAYLLCPESVKPLKLFSAGELTSAGRELLDNFVLRLKRDKGAWGLISLNQEYKKPEEVERMRRSLLYYLGLKHRAVRDRLLVNLSYQAEEMELFILVKGQKQPTPFPDR